MQVKGLYQKRGWWYYQPPTTNGKRPGAIAMKTQDEGDAINKAFKLYQAKALGAVSKDRMSVMVAAYLEAKWASRSHTGKTAHSTKVVLDMIVQEWNDPIVSAISEQMVLTLQADLRGRKVKGGGFMSEASVDTYLRRLRGFLSWLLKQRHIREHPMGNMVMPRVKKTRREKFLTIAQREMLLKEPEDPAKAPSEEAFFVLYFGFFAGLRIEEMIAMEPEWFHKSAEGLVLSVQKTKYWQPKDKEARTIVVHPRLEEFINNYGMRRPFMLKPQNKKWKQAPNYRYNPRKTFKTYLKHFGLDWAGFHTLRHSFGVHMASAGASMIEIADALGDSVEVTERTYVAFSPSHAHKRTITAI